MLAGGAAAELKVVATIAPIHSLVAGVMAGVGEPILLIPGGASPHAYAMRPSGARALDEADIVVWVGASMETFLERPLASIASDVVVVALAAAPGVSLLPARAGGAFVAPDRETASAGAVPSTARRGKGGPLHDHDFNPHIWLSLDNAAHMIASIAAALRTRDAANAAAYGANAAALLARLRVLEGELGTLLEPVHDVPYAVFHDAYQYLEAEFALRPIGAITVSPDQRPGARRLAELRARIVATGARCLFVEPQFPPALVDTLLAGTGARTGELDPLGADLAPGPELYFTLMRRLAASFNACLAAG